MQQYSYDADSPIEKIVIIVAMQEEADPIIMKLNMQENNPDAFGFHPQLGLNVYHVNIQQKDVYLIVNGYDVIHNVDRVGTQAAALTAFTAIEKLHPDTLISAGTAGSLKAAQVGDVFINRGRLIYHDRRISLGNFSAYGKGSFACMEMPLAAKLFGLKSGIISTGNSLDTSLTDMALLTQYDVDVVDMEAAAIAEVAQRLGVRMLAVKAITNFIDQNLHGDFKKNYHLTVTRLAEKMSVLIPFILHKKPSQLNVQNS